MISIRLTIMPQCVALHPWVYGQHKFGLVGVLWFTRSFITFLDSGGIVSSHQSMGKWKTYNVTHSVHFSLEQILKSFLGKYSSDFASSKIIHKRCSGSYGLFPATTCFLIAWSFYILNCLTTGYFQYLENLLDLFVVLAVMETVTFLMKLFLSWDHSVK